MRYPREHKEQTRQRIVRAAAKRFRRRGTEGAAIGSLMKDLQLTQAFTLALQDVRERFAPAVKQARKGEELKAVIESYLSLDHCEHPESGCPVACLATEIARRPRSARAVFLGAVKHHLAVVAPMFPGATEEQRLLQAQILFSGMAGTLTVARAATDVAEKARMLEAARAFYLRAAGY
jgi:TetR/AcrR family transcriptional regulator, transcriptional repressor for nem operon